MASVQNNSPRAIEIETPGGEFVIVPPVQRSPVFLANGTYIIRDMNGKVLLRFVLSDANVMFIPPNDPGSGSGGSTATAIQVEIVS